MTPIKLADSKNIAGAAFDATTGILEVSFDGSRYRYSNFTQELADAWAAAPSAGAWFDKNVRKKIAEFPAEKIADEKPADDKTEQKTESMVTIKASPQPAVVVDPPAAVQLAVDERRMPPDVLSEAESNYVAYCANSNNKNYQGNECPAWSALPSAVRSHWCAVAQRIKRANSANFAEMERMRSELDKLQRATGALDQRRVDAAARDRTEMLEKEIASLREKHVKLEVEHAELKKQKSPVMPWQKGG